MSIAITLKTMLAKNVHLSEHRLETLIWSSGYRGAISTTWNGALTTVPNTFRQKSRNFMLTVQNWNKERYTFSQENECHQNRAENAYLKNRKCLKRVQKQFEKPTVFSILTIKKFLRICRMQFWHIAGNFLPEVPEVFAQNSKTLEKLCFFKKKVFYL